jgi:hypothetical protein
VGENRPIVINYRSGQAFWLIVAAISIVLFSLFLGNTWGSRLFDQEVLHREQLQERVVQLEQQLTKSVTEVNRLQLSSKVDVVALDNIRREMLKLQQQIYRRDQELRLYRDMLQTKDDLKAPAITDFQLVGLEDGRIKYQWVAVKKTAQLKVTSVFADIWILGKRGDTSVRLPLNLVDRDVESLPIKLRYKYFSINEGIMQLPPYFVPERVRFTLRHTLQGKIEFDQNFDWKLEV